MYDIFNNSSPQNISRLFERTSLIHQYKPTVVLLLVISIFNVGDFTNNIIQLIVSAPKFGTVCQPKYANCQQNRVKKKIRESLFAIFHAEDTYVEASTLF